MITRLEIKNFLSLRQVDFAPGPINVLIGPNGAGKTNVYKALKLLKMIAEFGLKPALNQMNGSFMDICWKGSDVPVPVSFHVECQSPIYNSSISPPPGWPAEEFTYDLEISGNLTSYQINHERLSLGAGPGSILGETNAKGSTVTLSGQTIQGAACLLENNLPTWKGEYFKQILRGFRFYELNASSMKGGYQISPASCLNEKGDNLVSFLASIRSHSPDQYQQIHQVMRDTFPWVSNLVEQPMQNGIMTLAQHESSLRRSITSQNMADGELLFYALLALILAPVELGGSLAFIEEPEKHLHPRLMEVLMEILRQRQQERLESQGNLPQIFATTHSPQFVNYCRLDEILIAEKKKGETIIRRADAQNELKQHISEMDSSLGELWYSGAMGGV